MAITHAKVSGLTNPDDTDLVGGEDWDEPHVVSGPAIVGVALLTLTEGGAILSQASSGFASSFSKIGTGMYRAYYDPSSYNNDDPIVIASLSYTPSASASVRWTLENDGDDYLLLQTIDNTGAAFNLGVGYLTVHAAAIL